MSTLIDMAESGVANAMMFGIAVVQKYPSEPNLVAYHEGVVTSEMADL